jgi:hypothetical protein
LKQTRPRVSKITPTSQKVCLYLITINEDH